MIKPSLQMKRMLFNDFKFNCSKEKVKDLPVEAKYKVNFHFIDNNNVSINFSLFLSSNDEKINLIINQYAEFTLVNDNDIIDEIRKQLLTVNALAIMYPYMRSQVSLLTTQPDMIPIVLQPVDATLLVENATYN